MKRLVREAHQRSLWQALVVYLGVSYGILEAIDLFIDRAGVPDWLFPVALTLLLIGLPVVIVASLAAEEEYGDEVATESAVAAAEEDRRLRLLTWRNAAAALVGALAVWGAVAAGWLLTGDYIDRLRDRGIEAAAIDPANRVVVLPFTYRGSEEWAYLGEGMVDLLSKTLDGAGELRTVNPQAVLGVLEQVKVGEGTDPGRAVAERLDVGNYVVGNVVEVGGRLQLTAWLHRTAPVEPVQVSVQGPPDSLFALVDDLTARLLVSEENLGSLARIEALTTDSLEALKAYLEGEQIYRAGVSADRGDAHSAFQRAVEIDSTFALAWYRLSRLAYFSGKEVGQVLEYAETAVRHAERLPWRERRLIEANAAYARGDAGESQRIFDEILSRYPDDAEAWWGLALLLSEYYGILGLPPSAGRFSHQRTLRYEPDHDIALWSLAWIEAMEGNWQAFDSITLRRYGDRKPSLYWRAVRAFGSNDVAEQERVLATVDSFSSAAAPQFFTMAVTSKIAGNQRGALQLLEINERKTDSPQDEAVWHLFAAYYELGMGRRRAAQERFARLDRVKHDWAIVDNALWVLAPHVRAQRAELEAWRDSLLRWDAAAVVDPPAERTGYWKVLWNRYAGVHTHLQHYLLGRINARLGDQEAALRYADELEHMPVPPDAGSLSRDLAQSVLAYVLVEQGRSQEALRALEVAPREVPFTRMTHAIFQGTQERYLRAELLAELGRDEEALRWFQSIDYYIHPAMAGLSHLRQAQLHERLGHPEEAAVQYRRFIELWSDCDREFRPMVEAAQQALQRLTAEPTTD
ncbi:MAG: hypothetical protein GWN32_18870 [Gemmatimonadetes bacterium]|nr:hypothetical protein [Gemmatimonadota bacterium]